MLLSVGNIGYQVGAVGIIAFTIAFLVVVRWWTDFLGRIIAGVLSGICGVLIMSTIRMLYPNIDPSFFMWRAIVFWLFGLGVWIALGSFIWAQFFAPRLRNERMTTRREFKDEQESDVGSRRSSSDGDPDDRAGSLH